LSEWFAQHTRLQSGPARAGDSAAGDTGAKGAGVTAGAGGTGGAAAAGPRGACTRGTGAAGTGGVGGAGAGDPTEPATPGAGGAGAVGAGAGGSGAGGAGAGGAGAVDLGAGGARGTVQPRPYFSQPPLQPASTLPAPSPYTEKTCGLTEHREPAFRPASPARTGYYVPRLRPPLVPSTHAMALRPSSVPLPVPLPPPPESSLLAIPDPESDHTRAASPTVSCLLATVVTGPSFVSTAVSALITELVDFDAANPLDYATALVAESTSSSPPSVGGECALGMDVLEDKQEDFECLAAAAPRFASMLLAPEGDPDALDIPTPRSYAEAITVSPSRANIVDSMWIFKVKRPPGSSPAFKAHYVARGFSQRHWVDYLKTFSLTPKMTTLWVLLHVAAQRDYDLRRPVYGLCHAPREWHDTLRTTLAALGFTPSTADPSLFLRTNTSLPPFYVLVYSIRDRERRSIILTQSHMVHQALQRFSFQFSSPQPTPLSTSHSLSAPPSDESVEPSGLYPELVKRVLRYLCSTSGMGLVLGGRGPVVLTGHADASWVDDLATQRSSQGYTFSLDNKVMIALCQEHRLEHRTKHIAIRYFLARELQQCGLLRLAYVATRANTANIFTKALPPGDHQRFSTVLGLAFVRDTSADKLSARAIPCVFLGFPPNAPGLQFYHPTSHRVLPSQDITFDESVPFYCLFPYRTAPLPPPPLFLALGAPPVDPLPPQAVDSGAAGGGAARGTASGDAEPAGAGPGGTGPECVEPGGAELRVAKSEGAEPGGAEPEPKPGGAEPGAAGAGEPSAGGPGAGGTRATGPGGVGAGGVVAGGSGGAGVAAPGGAGGDGAAGPGGARTGGTGAARAGGAAGFGAGGAGAGAAGGTGAAGLGGARTGGTRGTGAAGAGGAAGIGAGDPGAGNSRAGGAGSGGAGAVGAGCGGTVRPRPYFVPLLQQVLGLPSSTGLTPPLLCPPPDLSQPPLQPASLMPAPSPYIEQTGGLIEHREPAFCPASPFRAVRTGRRVLHQRPPPVPDMHHMALRPSYVPLHVPLPSPPASSLADGPDPESDLLRAACPIVIRLLAIVVTNPSFESTAASALVAELVDFAAACRLEYAASLVAESKSVCPPSVRGECALGTDVFEDWQEDFECFAAAVPHLLSMLIAPEGDPDAPDILTPRSYTEAITSPYSSEWQTAMDTEMASWKSTGTYVDAVPPPGANIVDGTWIFRVKRPPGSPPAFKARYRDYELHSLDFSTAFLQGSLHEEMWLRHPPGFIGSFPAGTQWSLRQPVYGLRQAPREWHDTLRTTLAALGFAPSTVDPSLFLRTDTLLPPFYILVYVDDLVCATADTKGLALVKSELQKRHTCTYLGELRSYLGLQITRDGARRTITLTKSHIVHQALQRVDFQYSSPQSIRLPTGHSLSAPPLDESVEPSGPYPELVGCLMYLMTCTRPDLAYPLSILARYVAPGSLRPEHWKDAKRVLRYLCSTSGTGLVLRGQGPVVLTGHADASWVDNLATQWSSQGYTFSLGSGSVSWRSTRSSSVLSSSYEAKIYAGAMAAQELRWLTYLLTDLGEPPRSLPVLYLENKTMIALCQEHTLEHWAKHIAMQYFLGHADLLGSSYEAEIYAGAMAA
ncbi:unnamed protein product, partial [Closterium sp. NIES-53]